ERQQTLRSTIRWSFELLDEPLQQALCRLAVFGGAFSLEAAEAVAQTDLDQIAALLEWSLLKSKHGRFLMLETIREFAREQADLCSDWNEVRDRHLRFFVKQAEDAEPQLTGPDQRLWYARLEDENADVRE